MPEPDHFNSRAYRNAYEAPVMPVEPPLYAATRDDIIAMQKARGWLVVALNQLRENPWTFDSTEIPPHAFLVADGESFLEQMDKALIEAKISAGWM